MTSELDQTYAKATDKTGDADPAETGDFEEILAEAVYEGLSWVSGLLAPTLDAYIRGATTVEIGMRKTKLNVSDCETLEKGLQKVFGFGAKVVESRILKILNSKLGVSKKIDPSFRFSDEVKASKRLYKSKQSVRNTH